MSPQGFLPVIISIAWDYKCIPLWLAFLQVFQGSNRGPWACLAHELSLQLSTWLLKFALLVFISQPPSIHKWGAAVKRMFTEKTEESLLQGGKPYTTEEESALGTIHLPYRLFLWKEFPHLPKLLLPLLLPPENELPIFKFQLPSLDSF